MTLREKITGSFCCTGYENLLDNLEKICIQEQISLLEELKNHTEDTNAKFRLMLSVKIDELKAKINTP